MPSSFVTAREGAEVYRVLGFTGLGIWTINDRCDNALLFIHVSKLTQTVQHDFWLDKDRSDVL